MSERQSLCLCLHVQEKVHKKTQHVTFKHNISYTQINMRYSIIVKIDKVLCAEEAVGLLLKGPSLLMKTFHGNRDKRFSFNVFSFAGDPCEW